jgi:hypothetical protein
VRALVFSLAAFSCLGAGLAEPGPQPPCGGEATPAYPDLEHSPAFKVWDRSSNSRKWMPPACLGWSAPGFVTLVTTVARFRYSGGVSELLGRVGAISQLTGIRYWSTTRQHWAPLIVSASALAGPEGTHHRQDFSLPELTQGSTLYYQQSDNTSGKATSQLRIVTVSTDRLIFETENITAMRYLLVPIFPPHEFQAIYFLERESPEVWRYYSIGRTGKDASGLAAGHDASTMNRAMAFFRYLVGIPTDQEPPAVR